MIMRYSIVLLSLSLLVGSCDSRPSFTIEGNISDAPGSQVYLNRRDKGKLVVVDSAKIEEDGLIHLDGNIELPQSYYITVNGKRGYKMLFVENGNLEVYGSADSLYNLEVQGSVTQAQYELYSAGLEKLYNLSSDLFDQQHLEFFEGDSSKGRAIEKERRSIEQKIRIYQADFIVNNSSSFASPVILRSLSAGLTADSLQAMINLLDPAVKESEVVKELVDMVARMRTLTPGNPAPLFSQADRDGNPVALEGYLGDGPVLLHFWSSWCSACRDCNLLLTPVYEKYHRKGFKIIGISLDSSRQEWLGAIEEDQTEWIQLSDLGYWDNEVALIYNVTEIPCNYLIGTDGKIIASHLEIDELEAMLAGM